MEMALLRAAPLKINTNNIACNSIDGCHSLVLSAQGGSPYVGKLDAPGAGRYWEFAYSTLVQHIVKAAASFGKRGISLPSPKEIC
jgi:hypothetical protein